MILVIIQFVITKLVAMNVALYLFLVESMTHIGVDGLLWSTHMADHHHYVSHPRSGMTFINLGHLPFG